MSARKRRRSAPLIGELPVSEDVRREIETHLAAEAEALVAEGWKPAEAMEEAERRFGDVRTVREDCERIAERAEHQVRRARWWEGLRQDVRVAIRRLVRAPAFAVMAALTLALGVGANTAIFSMIQGVLLAPLPYPEPHRLVSVAEEHEGGRANSLPWANYVDFRERAGSFEALALYGAATTTVLGGDQPLRTDVASVSVDFFTAFGVAPIRGRFPTAADHRLGAASVAVVSERFWRNQMGGGSSTLDRMLRIYGQAVQVVGVLPAAFDFPHGTDVWTPLEIEPQPVSRTAHNWNAMARLSDGVSVAAADRELDAVARRLLSELGDEEFDAVGGVVTPLKESLVGESRAPLLLLMGASFLILLIACVNLGGTLLARGTARVSELAVRAALGASRRRLVRQLLTETIVISVVGGAAGILVAALINFAAAQAGAAALPGGAQIALNLPVLAFSLALTLLTTFLIGLLPALRLAREGLAHEVGSGGARSGEGPGRRLTWRLIVGSQVALALLLLVGTGLLVRSFATLLRQDTGVEMEGVVMAQLAPDPARFDSLPDVARWYEALLDEVRGAPGIANVGLADTHPIGGASNGTIQLDGDMSSEATGFYVAASPGYFATLEIPVLRGRLFDGRDRADAADVALVSQSFADRVWPGLDPIGRQLTGGGMDNYWDQQRFATVIGVVGDVRYRSLGQSPEPTIYFPLAQRPFRTQSEATVVVRGREGSQARSTVALRATLERFDPELPPRISLLSSFRDDSVADRRFLVLLLGAFAAVALLLSLVGVYGVVSYRVARRTREIGVRIALGARPIEVMGLVMKDSLVMVTGGLAVGLLAALLGGRLLRDRLFEVSSYDPVTVLVTIPVLALGAVLATWVPARRAMRVEPTTAIRAE